MSEATAAATSTDSSSSSSSSSSPSSSSSASSSSSYEVGSAIDSEFEKGFHRSLHKNFVLKLEKNKDSFEYYITEHLRMSGIYWALMAMDLIGSLKEMDADAIVAFVDSCFDRRSGGFSGNVDHDPHLLYTLSAVQIYAILDRLDRIPVDDVMRYIKSLQQADGSFIGDEWGEVDTRFSYCALLCAATLSRLSDLNISSAVSFLCRCRNFDGGFGAVPGAESHAGQIFCCVGALALVEKTEMIDADLLGWWLSERQLSMGGLNGRPEKKQDVCYSWWVLTSLATLGRTSWIDGKKLIEYILTCQDDKDGGISDRPGNVADVFHTYFGIAGLSLLGCKGLNGIDPVYALPTRIVEKLKLPIRYPKIQPK